MKNNTHFKHIMGAVIFYILYLVAQRNLKDFYRTTKCRNHIVLIFFDAKKLRFLIYPRFLYPYDENLISDFINVLIISIQHSPYGKMMIFIRQTKKNYYNFNLF